MNLSEFGFDLNDGRHAVVTISEDGSKRYSGLPFKYETVVDGECGFSGYLPEDCKCSFLESVIRELYKERPIHVYTLIHATSFMPD